MNEDTVVLTRDAWGKFAPGCPAAWTDALFANFDLLRAHGLLESELRWCHFAGTVYEETGNFKELRENLYYTTQRALVGAWPSRFGHLSASECSAFLRNPRALANKVYNGRMGNRVGSSDGYDFRGGGWIQTTGRSAVEEYSKQLGIMPGPGTLDDPLITLQFALLEWTNQNCNKWADENNIVKIAKAINTGSADSNVTPVGMDLRRAAFARAWKQWGEYGVADVPAKKAGIGELTAKATLPATVAATVVNTLSSSPAGEATAPIVSRIPDIAPKLVAAQPKINAALDQADQALTLGNRFRGVGGQLNEFGMFLMGNPSWLILMVLSILVIGFWPRKAT